MEKRDVKGAWSSIDMINYLPPEANRVLILAPHPDDETLGCGGTIALYTSKGSEVRIVIISDGGQISQELAGEGINVVEMRKQESIEASKILGIGQTYFLCFPDGELALYKDEMKEKIEDIVREFNPDIVFAPSPIDYYADHIAVSEIALKLLTKIHGMRIAFYEIYGTIRFNALVDISSVIDVKEKAILKYHCSLFHTPEVFHEAVKGLNRFRSFYTRENRYYEAFWIVSKPMDKTEIIDWLTYGMKEEDPAVIFLSKLKAVDELLFEFRRSNDLLKSREAEIQELKTIAENRGKNIDELRMRLDNITGSLLWKLATKFYMIRDRLLPTDSVPRRIYDKVLGRIKANLK